LADKLFALIMDRDLTEVWELEQRAKPLFLAMCVRGISLDQGRWARLIGELEDKVVHLKEKVDELAPSHPEVGTWNWNSPKQAKEAFSLAGLKVPDLKRETLCNHDHPLVEAVAEYRDTQSLLSRVRTWGRAGTGTAGSTRSGTPLGPRQVGHRARHRTCRVCPKGEASGVAFDPQRGASSSRWTSPR
jgi:hypothetical protein